MCPTSPGAVPETSALQRVQELQKPITFFVVDIGLWNHAAFSKNVTIHPGSVGGVIEVCISQIEVKL